jgi:hypothetical protein
VVNNGASIAYQVFGDGPDLVLIAGFTTNVEVQWEHAAIARFLRRLGSFAASQLSTSGAADCRNASVPAKHHRSNSGPTTCAR